MTTFANEIFIEAPPEEVWEALADFSGVHRFHPTVSDSRSLTDDDRGLGATRQCDLTLGGGQLEERISSWDEGRSYSLDIVGGKRTPPFESAVATMSVRSAAGGSIASAQLVYTLRGGLLGSLMDRTMVAPKFRPAFADLLRGLKHHVETGEVVTEQTPLDYEVLSA